jgi:excisionase family DNA binding protein
MQNPFDEIMTAINRLEQLVLKSIEKSNSSNLSESMLTIEEAANYLHIPKTTLYQYTSQRKIPFSKPGRSLLFRKTDLDDFVMRCRKEDLG